MAAGPENKDLSQRCQAPPSTPHPVTPPLPTSPPSSLQESAVQLCTCASSLLSAFPWPAYVSILPAPVSFCKGTVDMTVTIRSVRGRGWRLLVDCWLSTCQALVLAPALPNKVTEAHARTKAHAHILCLAISGLSPFHLCLSPCTSSARGECELSF